MSLRLMTEAEIKNTPAYRWPSLCLDFDIWSLPKVVNYNRSGQWTEVKFEKSSIPLINNLKGKQGIYVFLIKPNDIFHVNQSYILYVGETDDLHRRFESYFHYRTSNNPSDMLKRRMIILWEDYLYFNYVITNYATKKEREEEEYDLIDCINPPMNDKFRSKILKGKRKELKHIIKL